MSEMFQFGSPGAQFDTTPSSSFGCYPNDIENGAFSGEKSQSASSMDQSSFADGDRILLLLGSATPSGHSLLPCDSTAPKNATSTRAGVLRVGDSQDTCSDINQDVPLLSDFKTKDMNMDTVLEDANISEMEPSTDLSQDNPSTFDPQTAFRESAQSRSVRSLSELASLN